ncbi:MAG: hypothetical protein AAB548_00825 [Patescibacteria group bacterium]
MTGFDYDKNRNFSLWLLSYHYQTSDEKTLLVNLGQKPIRPLSEIASFAKSQFASGEGENLPKQKKVSTPKANSKQFTARPNSALVC